MTNNVLALLFSKKIFILIALFSLLCANAYSREVTLSHQGITLNANFIALDHWQQRPVLLITHGTLSHNKNELIATLQELFAENDISSLALNLSLGLDNRHKSYDCAIPHTHQHEDAITEIDIWLHWLQQQGAKNIILTGHSRGGNQTAWYASEHDSSLVSKIILIAPQLWSPKYAREDYQKRFGKDLAPILARAQALVARHKGKFLLSPVDFIYCQNTKATAQAFVSYYHNDMRKDTLFLLPKIKKPVLLFAGTEDSVVKNLDKKFVQIPHQNNIHLKILEGADHSFRDLYVEEIVDEAVRFINSQK